MIKREVCDVGGEYFERLWYRESPVQFILKRSMFLGFLHDHFIRVAPSDLGYEMVLIHDPRYLLVIHNNSAFLEFHLDCSPAILRFPLKEQLVDFEVIIMIFFGFVRLL
jgi:hypothetical protein